MSGNAENSRNKHTCLGLLAHVDSGKTTLSEQILFSCSALRQAGRVDQQSAYLDYSQVERRRGITVFSDQADFTLHGRTFTLVDTPGHVDFSGEMERSLNVLDCAILLVSGVEGVQAHTETLWQLLKEKKIPTIIFINKLDRAGADYERVLEKLESRFGKGFIAPQLDDALNAENAEALAELDEGLLEEYLTTGYNKNSWLKAAQRLFANRIYFPVFSGAALKGEGIDKLLEGPSLYAPISHGEESKPFSGRVYKVRHDKGGKVVYIKVEQGVLRPKDIVVTSQGREKCNELRKYSGEKYELINEAGPGILCGVTGLKSPRPGDVVGGEGVDESFLAGKNSFSMRPLLSAKVMYDKESTPAPVMLSHLRLLEEEEPLLGVTWNERTQDIEVRIMGEIQLEILREMVHERWNIKILFGPCSVLYEETLISPVVGVGHFEPLKHYAEVHLLLSPGKKGSGITFQSRCSLDDLSSNWENLVRTHVLEKQHLGVLTGAPLTDVSIILLSGRAHLKHTEGGDFREATYRAVRQGLMQGKSRLLEPYYNFTAEVELNEGGRIQADIARLGGECQAPVIEGGRMVLHGRGPVRTLMSYPRTLTVFTKGKGRMAFRYGGYEECAIEKQVVAEVGYEPERDLENTPDSVFCSHGAGFPVKWHEAPSYMHLPVETIQSKE